MWNLYAMKMNKLVILFLLAMHSLHAQENKLRFIIGSPYHSGNRFDEEYPVFLSGISNAQLQILDTLSTKLYYALLIKVHHNQRLAVILKEQIRKTRDGENIRKEKFIVKIDLDHPDNPTEISIGLKNYIKSLQETILFKKGKDYCYVVEFINNDEPLAITSSTTALLGINLSNLTTFTARDDDYAHSILVGESGGMTQGCESVLRVKNNGQDNLLRIPITHDFSKRPVFDIKLPDEVRLNVDTTSTYIINAIQTIFFP